MEMSMSYTFVPALIQLFVPKSLLTRVWHARNTVTDLWCLSAGVGLVYFMLYMRVAAYSMLRRLASLYGAPVQPILAMLSPLCLSNG
jgi:hypothetical protein